MDPDGKNPGPLDIRTLALLHEAAVRLSQSFAQLPEFVPAEHDARIAAVLDQVTGRLADNYPYFHPLYAGQMLKPPHPVARLAYSLAMFVNPNNHALDGGRASSQMEKEAVAEIAAMFGWQEFIGHLCGGGTVANLEALWVAGQLHRGKTIVASSQAHYTHSRISGVLRIPFAEIACDGRGRMDVGALEACLKTRDVGCVVATLGTTAVGAVDPLPAILQLREKYGFRVHVDAAYGGYFTLADNLAGDAMAAFDRIGEADSIVIDPHKHGLQPYGCGCVLFRDPAVGKLYKHDSPYTYFTSSGDLHLGEISLECSRAGASAVALWATQKLLPLTRRGEFADGLSSCRAAALAFHARLSADPRWVTPFPPELDIVVWAPRVQLASQASNSSREIFAAAARHDLHLALATLPARFFANEVGMKMDTDSVTCLRSVLMKPEHQQWVKMIGDRLDEAAAEVMRR
ncbi:MAG: aminotransferase class I/II-fold pyridoxal phosphate-dependent enzyme [Terriglobales bacterium]